MRFDIEFEGRQTINVSRGEAADLGYPEEAIDAAEQAAHAAADRSKLRERIIAGAGDTDSLLGTVADVSTLMLAQLAQLAAALSTAQSLAEMRAAAQPLADLTNDLRARIDSGEIHFPHQAKGADAVIGEAGTRFTAIAVLMDEAEEAG
ncbi:hypothetical protein [Novosphingopyxis sp. YJ-S2-01]|uniref:hypothetical protein n=1 Tax=Novosphingopyxis sp. YJ-S2-01 TaxID=2794021 RepID=UPI0018DDF2F3|nr:hypothetical protein [Novosphingopyxis sp. YJ-S2-01]MBH9537904.1 hypothetical protein [Novosphingopyxis sp. YJ-S2-01]